MDANAALEVFIGLAAMYLLLALICTIINETVATVLGWRASTLRKGLNALLADENFANLAKDVLGTPILKKALGTAGMHGASYLPSRQFASGILEYIGTGKLTIDNNGVNPADLVGIIDNLPESELKSRLSTFAREAAGDIEGLRLRVAEWYDDTMERWSGNYKRRAQRWSYGIALVIVVALNADTVSVAKHLWNDPAARAAALAVAEQLAQEGATESPRYAQAMEQLRPFPLGWGWLSADEPSSSAPASGGGEAAATAPASGGVVACVSSILGLAMSALAVGLGAPFWFDVLNRLNAIRGAGKKPEPATPTS